MKILLTGYSGFLGRYIGTALAQKGFSIRVLLHSTAVRRRDFDDEIEVVWGSMLEPGTIEKAVQGVQAVVHSAWIWPRSMGENKEVNEQVAVQLWEKSLEAKVSRFGFISSVAVYGMKRRKSRLIDEPCALTEGPELMFDYPRQKVAVESLLRARSEDDSLKLCIFRPGILFDESRGPGQILKVGSSTWALGIGNGRNHLPLIHVADVAEAVVRWIENGEHGKIYNVTPSRSLRSKEWVRAWCNVNNVQARPIFVPKLAVWSAGTGMTTLKRILGQQSSTSVKYVLASATRDLQYSNEALKQDLAWSDERTATYSAE